MSASRLLLCIMCAAACLLGPASADPRIRTVTYTPERVISLVGHYGYQISIEFPAGERIENVAIGDSLAWQVTPNKRGDVLIVKPVDIGEPTNLTVMTQARRYSFELAAKPRKPETPISEITYVLRIKLPQAHAPEEPEADAPATTLLEAKAVNSAYTYSGSSLNLPSRVYDNGVTTSFEWPVGAQTPAIFVVGPDGKDVIVNYSYAGERIVVHQVAQAFILRNGAQVTTIYNDGYAAPAPGPEAPQPRQKRKKGFLFFGADEDGAR